MKITENKELDLFLPIFINIFQLLIHLFVSQENLAWVISHIDMRVNFKN